MSKEPKQELLPDFRISKDIFDFVTDLSDSNEEVSKQEKNTIITDWLEEHGDSEIDKKVEKQLELEEAAEKHYEEQSKSFENDEEDPIFDISRYLVCGFIDGAKWQSERMYSEEEVKRILMKTGNYTKISLDAWFEQFKKK
jgi:hypothetical protein